MPPAKSIVNQDRFEYSGRLSRLPNRICPMPAGRRPDQEAQPDVDAKDEKPAQVGDDPSAAIREGGADRARRDDQCEDEDQHESGRNQENDWVGPQAQTLYKCFHHSVLSSSRKSVMPIAGPR